jgi:hypothetical protein
MKDLIEQLKREAGLTDKQAHQSVDMVKAYVLAKVPPMFSAVVESFFAKNAPDAEVDILEPNLSREAEKVKAETTGKIDEIAGEAKDEMATLARDAVDRIDELAAKAEEAARDAIDHLKNVIEEGKH